MDKYELHIGDALEVLKTMPDQYVNCWVTSPPYWGLRDYGTATWEGGNSDCDHLKPAAHGYKPFETSTLGPNKDGISENNASHRDEVKRQQFSETCKKCGAVRIDQQLGLEKTPEEYVAKMVEIFREARRVLRDDGTLWLNLGDTYCANRGNTNEKPGYDNKAAAGHASLAIRGHKIGGNGLKEKDIVGIPWMVAFALRADGWYLRQDIIWHKPNPMPESVKDRCTKSHEYIFLMSKNQRYYYDYDSIKTPVAPSTIGRGPVDFGGEKGRNYNPDKQDPNFRNGSEQWGRTFDYRDSCKNGVNKRSVWTVSTKPFSGAHFATFPPDLIEPCILAGCPEGGIVGDMFAGSGTTGEVALKHFRRFVGIELNPTYANEIAIPRIEAEASRFKQMEII